jgi:hypothetical protein
MNKGTDSDRPGAKVEDATRIAQAMEAAQVGRRVATLEDDVRTLENSLVERHAKLITIIFSCMTAFVALCAILVTALGFLSKSESREATKEMESKVKEALVDMDKRFLALAGEALKKPALQLLSDGAPLESRVIDVPLQVNVSGMPAPLATLFVKNTGEKRTEPLSIRISLAASVGASWDHQDWEPAASFDKEFAASFYSTRHATVAPGETLNIHTLSLVWDRVLPWGPPGIQTNVPCKIQVFYGGEKPAEAQFQIRLQRKP